MEAYGFSRVFRICPGFARNSSKQIHPKMPYNTTCRLYSMQWRNCSVCAAWRSDSGCSIFLRIGSGVKINVKHICYAAHREEKPRNVVIERTNASRSWNWTLLPWRPCREISGRPPTISQRAGWVSSSWWLRSRCPVGRPTDHRHSSYLPARSSWYCSFRRGLRQSHRVRVLGLRRSLSLM